MRSGPYLFLGLGLPAALLLMTGASGQQRPQQEVNQPRPSQQAAPPVNNRDKIIEQSFPPNDVMETAWRVEWDTEIRHGLVIKNAWFKRSPKHPWMEVLGDTRVVELFVPYHRGTPRFWDVAQYKFELTKMSAADAGPYGKLHTSHNGKITIPCVVEEIKDRGIIWKSSDGVRRGHTLILWAAIDAANYRYLIEYGFQDDGCITFRVGATGHNLNGSEYEPHMHNVYWRIDINLDDKDHNTALLMERIEAQDEKKIKAETIHTVFNNGKEGGADWDPHKFTMLRVVNTQKKNVRNVKDKLSDNYGYDLMVSRMGNSRHFGKDEEATQHDFWVTKAKPNETNFKKLPSYCDDEDIIDTDIAIWYGSPVFHEPRSEDGKIVNGKLVGCTHVGWSSFTLRPSNIFDHTPMFPYDKIQMPPPKGKGKAPEKDRTPEKDKDKN
jgi:primary-amine oxidase